MQWGRWVSNSGSPSYWQNFAGSESDTLTTFILVSAPTTDTATLNKLVGNVTYTGTGSYVADKNTGSTAIHDISSSLTVNVSTGAVTAGTLNICMGISGCTDTNDPWEEWAASFTGTLSSGKFTSTLSGSISEGSGNAPGLSGGLNVFALDARNVEGTVTGNFTGTSGEGFVLGFRANEVGVSSNSIIGASLLKTSAPITQTEIDALTYRGFAIVGPNTGASNLGISIGAGGNLVDRQIADKEILLYSQNPGFVINTGGNQADSGTLINGVSAFDITWGRWTGISGEELKYQTSLSNSALYNKLAGKVIVATGTPSPSAVLVGSKYFESTATSSAFIAGGDEAPTSIKGQFNIDFGTGALTNGKIEVISDTYHWTTDTFTGTVSNGTLPVTGVTGDVTIDGEVPTLQAFSGNVAGHFVGNLARGFLAAYDFKQDADSLHSFGAVLINAVNVPVLSTAGLTAFSTSTRYGFILGEELEEDGLLSVFGKVTQYSVASGEAGYDAAQVGATQDLISSDPADLLAVDETPSIVVKRNNASLGSFSASVNESSVNWGKWTSSDARIYSVFADDSQYETLDQAMINVNFVPTTAAQFTTIGSVTRSYAGGNYSTFGKVDNSLVNAYASVLEIRSVFDINFGTGALTNGLLDICMAYVCSNTSADRWEFGFSGTLSNGILLDATTDSAKHNNSAVTVSGTVLGGFTGSGANTFVGGFNYIENANSGHYMRGSFLLHDTSFLSGEAISGFNDNEYGFLSFSDHVSAGVYGGASQRKGNSSNYLITDTRLNSSPSYDRNGAGASFHNDSLDSFFRKGGAGVTTTANVGGLGTVVTWGKWAGGTGSEILRDSLGSTPTDLEVDAYWFIATPSVPTATTGRWEYSTTSAIQGSGSDGPLAMADLKSFGFVLDLSNGSISAGRLKIEIDSSWDVAFTGNAKNDTTGQGPFLSLAISSLKYNGDNIDQQYSSLAGMLVNTGQHAATAFSLTNSSTESNVAGTILTQRKSADLDVEWGSWNAPLTDNWDSQLKTDIQTNIFSALQLTPHYVINNLVGTGEFEYDFASGAGAGYGSAAGALSSVAAEMQVDFDSANISDGHVTVVTSSASGSQSWHSHFSGSFQGNSVSLTSETSSFTIGGSPNAGATSFTGAFTGESAGGFVGAFEMIDAANSQNFVQGAFTLGKGSAINNDI